MHADTLNNFLNALIQLFVLVALPILGMWAQGWVKNRRLSAAIGLLTDAAGRAVAARAHQVRDAKDRAKPGEWSQETARAFMASVVEDVKRELPEQVAAFGKNLAEGKSVEDALRTMAEAEVEKLRANGQSRAIAVAENVTVAAPAAPAEAPFDPTARQAVTPPVP